MTDDEYEEKFWRLTDFDRNDYVNFVIDVLEEQLERGEQIFGMHRPLFLRSRIERLRAVPGVTFQEKLETFSKNLPLKPLRRRFVETALGVQDVLEKLARIEKHTARRKRMNEKPTPPPTPAADPVEQAKAEAQRTRTEHEVLRVWEEQMKDELAQFDPNSEEYKRRRARWMRKIEEFMKR